MVLLTWTSILHHLSHTCSCWATISNHTRNAGKHLSCVSSTILTKFRDQCSCTLDNLLWPIQIPPFHFENYTHRQLWSCELFPQETTSLDFEARNNLIWFSGIRVKRVNKTHRHGVPLPHVWLNDHFPARLTSQQISFHDHFSLFLFLAWLSLFKLRGRGERIRERISFPSLRFCVRTAEWASIIEKAQTTTGWPC